MKLRTKEKELPHQLLPPMNNGSKAKLPSILLPYQQRVNRAIENSSVTFIEKSRRIGVTWGVGAQAVLMAAVGKSAGGMDVLYIGYNIDMTREFIDVCASWARVFGRAASTVDEFMFKDDDEKEIKAFRITFDSGFEIVALSSRPRSLRGRQGCVIIDEAAFHDDLKEMMKAALAMLIWGGKVVVVSTHNGVDNAFNQYIEDIRKKKYDYALLRIDFDDALREGLFERRCLVKGEEWSQEAQDKFRNGIVKDYGDGADEELFCIPALGGGAYIPSTLVEARMVDTPVLKFERDDAFTFLAEHIRVKETEEWCERELKPLLDALPRDLKSYLGEDFGRSVNLTVLWPCQVLKSLVRHTPFIVELFNIPFTQQLQIICYIIDRLPNFMNSAFDARGNGSQIAEQVAQKYGPLRVHRVMLTQEWYRENAPPYKAAFEDGMITVPRDSGIKDDHRALVMVRGVAQVVDSGGDKQKNSKKKRHGDAVIAGIMMWFATTQEIVEYGYTAASPDNRKRPGMRPRHDDGDRLRKRRFGQHKGAF